jgi:hypothetical protein
MSIVLLSIPLMLLGVAAAVLPVMIGMAHESRIEKARRPSAASAASSGEPRAGYDRGVVA